MLLKLICQLICKTINKFFHLYEKLNILQTPALMEYLPLISFCSLCECVYISVQVPMQVMSEEKLRCHPMDHHPHTLRQGFSVASNLFVSLGCSLVSPGDPTVSRSSVCYHTWLFHMGSGNETQVIIQDWQVFTHLSLTPPHFHYFIWNIVHNPVICMLERLERLDDIWNNSCLM